MDGVKINYKIGGRGPVVVLLHGYTQTSHMWIPLMPLLAASHTVIAPDLRGAGASERAKDGYDKKTLAKDIRTLVRQLGHEQVQLVGHDIGLMVAYAYAAQYPKEVGKVVLMDAFLPGIGNWKDVWLLRDLWHFHFYGDVPLALVKGRERIYFEHFWNDFAADKTKSVPEADRRIYAAAYARANGMRAGFEYFKTFEHDAKDFASILDDASLHAVPSAYGRESRRHLPHRTSQAGGIRRQRPGGSGLGTLADGGSTADGNSSDHRLYQLTSTPRILLVRIEWKPPYWAGSINVIPI